MDRRSFVKNTALSGALLAGTGLYAFEKKNSQSTNGLMYCSRPGCKLPIIGEVDVLVVGGTAAGVSSAVAASKNGASVFLVASFPYLGEDICGNFQLWQNASGSSSEIARSLWDKGVFRTPMYIKRTLDNALIDNGIPFLFNSRPSNILWDEKGNPAGVIISNRSGEQVIKAKIIIDASTTAVAARIAGCKLRDAVPGKVNFSFTVMGNKPKTADGLSYKELPVIEFDNIKYPVTEYTVAADWKDESMGFISEIEQSLRDKTWDEGEVDSSDLLKYITPASIVSKTKTADYTSSSAADINLFVPEKTERMFVVNMFSDVTRDSVDKMLNPVAMMEVGERIGAAAAGLSKKVVLPGNLGIKNPDGSKSTSIVFQYNYYTRPDVLKGTYTLASENIPVFGSCDVVVVGGGTAGAPAAISAARKGVKTILLEQLHMLGGMATAGIITSYFHGYKEGFTREVDKGTIELGKGSPRQPKKKDSDEPNPDKWVKEWKAEWFRKECRKAGTEIWCDVIVCGAVVENITVKGVVVSTPYGKGIILANTVIDSTGSADVAIAAGAEYKYTGDNIAVQGAGLPGVNPGQNYVNTDWNFIDDTDVFDMWRTFVVAKDKFSGAYDLGKILQTRERRRIVGDFEISVLDIYNGRKYSDSVSFHLSSFDTHGFTIDPFFYIEPPTDAHTDVLARVPLRSLLPKGLDGIVVTGLGASAHRDAMPVIRMQPCLQSQGYSIGILAAMAAKSKKTIRKIDIKLLQKELVKIGNLPESVLTDKDNFPPTKEQIIDALNKVTRNYDKLELIFWDKAQSLPLLLEKYKTSDDKKEKLVYATLLGLLGNGEGWKDIADSIDNTEKWDKGWNYRGMGQFGESMSHLDGMIIALGNSKKTEALTAIHRKAKKLSMASEFSHFRAISSACIAIGSKDSIPVLSALLRMPGVSGYASTTIQESKFYTVPNPVDTLNRNNCLREIFLTEALYRCGDENGMAKSILKKYSNDLCGHYANYAAGIFNKSA